MSLNQINSNLNHAHNSYISSLDLLNKYNLESLRMCPRIEKIVIKLDLSKLLIHSLDELDSNDQIKLFFMFYLLFSSIPLIKAKFIKNIKSSRTNILLKTTLRDLFSINEFVIRFFLENSTKINPPNSSQLKKEFVSSKFIYNSSIELSRFLDVNKFLSRVLSNSRINEVSLKLNFIFINFRPGLNNLHLIQNQFLFWST